jgi:hypothetical protein
MFRLQPPTGHSAGSESSGPVRFRGRRSAGVLEAFGVSGVLSRFFCWVEPAFALIRSRWRSKLSMPSPLRCPGSDSSLSGEVFRWGMAHLASSTRTARGGPCQG